MVEKMNEIFKITVDDRKITKRDTTAVIDIHQVQEMPMINVKNMIESWQKTNEQIKEYLEKEKEILETTLKEVEKKTKEKISHAENILAMLDEDKKQFLENYWKQEKENAMKLLKEKDRYMEESKNKIKQMHANMLVKLKTDLKNNEKGIEIYEPALK